MDGLVYNILFRDVFKKDELGLEIATIAIPAALALTADPIASLIDTAFIGHIGMYFIIVIYFFDKCATLNKLVLYIF